MKIFKTGSINYYLYSLGFKQEEENWTNGDWAEARYKPSWEDLFSNDWIIYPTDRKPIREDEK